jgi:hypothetical protein
VRSLPQLGDQQHEQWAAESGSPPVIFFDHLLRGVRFGKAGDHEDDHPAAASQNPGELFERTFRGLMSLSSAGLGQASWSETRGAGYGRGWANNPGSVSTRMPRLTRRLSLERMFSVFLGAIGKSRATQRSRARRGRGSAKAVRICW